MKRVTLFVPVAGALFLATLVSGCGPGSGGGAGDTPAARGRVAMLRYGCGTCHIIPGMDNARGTIGPSLEGLLHRTDLAGDLPHTRENLEKWIRSPRVIRPRTGMPTLGVTEQDAQDIITYLYEASGGGEPPAQDAKGAGATP